MARWLALLGVAVICSTPGRSACAQEPEALCSHGEGRFEAQLHSGAGVLVNPGRSGGFAERTCRASISWRGQNLVVVPSAAEIDIDVMGADLGLKVPVAAFQTRKSPLDWQADYEIYSLDADARRLRTITGGDSYRAVDSDFDGRIEIWTADVGAALGFDDMAYKDFEFAPGVVLRFEPRRLMDVSAEYPAHYDAQIAKVRTELDAEGLSDFRKSDGRLADGSLPADRLIALRRTKARVLEIVCAYVYSGREQEGWAELARDWPSADVERARAAVVAARRKGIDAQVDGIAGPAGHRRRGNTVVYDTPGTLPHGKPRGVSTSISVSTAVSLTPVDTLVDSPPRPILLLRENVAKSTETLELTIDAAGKVWSARLKGTGSDPEVLEAARQWKFIPAYRGDRPVACRDLLEVSPEQ